MASTDNSPVPPTPPLDEGRSCDKSPTPIRWGRVRQILHEALLAWQEANDGVIPDLRGAHGPGFVGAQYPTFLGWDTKRELQEATAKVRGDPVVYRLIEPGVQGKDTYLVQSLTTGVKKPDGGSHPKMPLFGPDVPKPAIEEIIQWIDDGMPD